MEQFIRFRNTRHSNIWNTTVKLFLKHTVYRIIIAVLPKMGDLLGWEFYFFTPLFLSKLHLHTILTPPPLRKWNKTTKPENFRLWTRDNCNSL
jgi:hypothetical protein